MTRGFAIALAAAACGNAREPAKVEAPPPVVPADAPRAADARSAPPPSVAAPPIATWSAAPATPSSPTCIAGGADRFIQYADLDEPGALRFCLWWNLGKQGFPDVGCWRVELATGAYVAQGGVWFSAPVPPRVGIGGGDASARHGVVAPTLVASACDDPAVACTWELRDAHGARIAAVGGASPLGEGGTAVALDAHAFAAVAGTRLVVQDAATGAVTARLELPHTPYAHASYVLFADDHQLVVPGPDGRVVLVDPSTAKVTRTITPPRCVR